MFTLPTSTEIVSGITSYTSVVFGELDTLVWLGVGLLFGGIALAYVGRMIVKAGGKVVGSRRRGGRRRR